MFRYDLNRFFCACLHPLVDIVSELPALFSAVLWSAVERNGETLSKVHLPSFNPTSNFCLRMLLSVTRDQSLPVQSVTAVRPRGSFVACEVSLTPYVNVCFLSFFESTLRYCGWRHNRRVRRFCSPEFIVVKIISRAMIVTEVEAALFIFFLVVDVVFEAF